MVLINCLPFILYELYNIFILVNEKSVDFHAYWYAVWASLHSYLLKRLFFPKTVFFQQGTRYYRSINRPVLSFEFFHQVVRPIPEKLYYLSSSHRVGFLIVFICSSVKERERVQNAAILKSSTFHPLYSGLTDIMVHKAVDVSSLCLV